MTEDQYTNLKGLLLSEDEESFRLGLILAEGFGDPRVAHLVEEARWEHYLRGLSLTTRKYIRKKNSTENHSHYENNSLDL